MAMHSFSLFLVCVLLFFSPLASVGQNEEPLIGDTDDGSRAVPVHRIPLLDEEQLEIIPDDEFTVPYSVRQTCANKCHSYETIQGGWHFNALNPNAKPGRPGQPWIYANAKLGMQIPLSYRKWKGTFSPAKIGLSAWEFIKLYGRQMPGGGPGVTDNIDPDRTLRWMVSGKLDINCLSCHDAHPAHDQGEFAIQIARENFRWAGAATSSFTFVDGFASQMPDTYDFLMPDPMADPKLIPPTVTYQTNVFDYKSRVFFDIVRQVPNKRCYFCHSTKIVENMQPGKWVADEDVHLGAGMQCVDCHRNDLSHNIVRGYPAEIHSSTNPLVIPSTCEGCHLGEKEQIPFQGRMTAPYPKHKGIPAIHFKKITCTACHSGPWPRAENLHAKTSMAHALGIHNSNKSDEALPHIQTPVFVREESGKIGIHHAVWPSYWATKSQEGIQPLPIKQVANMLGQVDASINWGALNEDTIKTILRAFAQTDTAKDQAVYIGAGKLFALNEEGNLIQQEHPAAQPYTWPYAHDVRPAGQSLGVNGCEDCHAVDSPFVFGRLAVDSPLAEVEKADIVMAQFQNTDAAYLKLFAESFWFRPLYKIIMLGLTFLLALVLLALTVHLVQALIDYFHKTTRSHY